MNWKQQQVQRSKELKKRFKSLKSCFFCHQRKQLKWKFWNFSSKPRHIWNEIYNPKQDFRCRFNSRCFDRKKLLFSIHIVYSFISLSIRQPISIYSRSWFLRDINWLFITCTTFCIDASLFVTGYHRFWNAMTKLWLKTVLALCNKC